MCLPISDERGMKVGGSERNLLGKVYLCGRNFNRVNMAHKNVLSLQETFAFFREEAEEIFHGFKNEDLHQKKGNIEEYQNNYMLEARKIYVAVDEDGLDSIEMKNLFVVWWGHKEIERHNTTWGQLDSRKMERGATLLIQQNIDGYVTIDLYPAYLFTERYERNSNGKLILPPNRTVIRKPSTEDFIRLRERIDPTSLCEGKIQRSIWDDFNAYMEYTRLDGKPSYKEQYRINQLRLLNKTGKNREGEWIIQDPKVKEYLVKVGVFMKEFIELVASITTIVKS